MQYPCYLTEMLLYLPAHWSISWERLDVPDGASQGSGQGWGWGKRKVLLGLCSGQLVPTMRCGFPGCVLLENHNTGAATSLCWHRTLWSPLAHRVPMAESSPATGAGREPHAPGSPPGREGCKIPMRGLTAELV